VWISYIKSGLLVLRGTMGTASDWMSAVFWGMLWAGGMLLIDVLSRRTRHIKPALSLMDILAGAFFGLGFGLGTTFRWKALHWPLILFIVVTFVSGTVFARLATRKLRSEDESGYGPADG
jgi:hypothetical protein